LGPVRTTLLLLIASALLIGPWLASGANSPAKVATPADPVVVAAAGDIACETTDPDYNGGEGRGARCRMRATAELLTRLGPDAVLALGDLQYPAGALNDFRTSYALTWGRVKPTTYPAPGNHEYGTPGAAGYYTYFGPRAGNPRRGYYSFDLGTWHLIALNSNCSFLPGGCGPQSPQVRWLRADLAAHRNRCALAYWHHPRFSSGPRGNFAHTAALFAELYAGKADIVLAGHEHNYERFGPQGPLGRANPRRGIRAFVVGTGGHSLYAWGQIKPNSQVRNNTTFGVLRLTLFPKRYSWRFLPVAGGSFTDSGSAGCR
jgi:3',5'-cyclic AMP phosphodiesterase CpdA